MLSKGLQTRNKILNKAIKLFAQKGLFGTSLQEVATNCGLSQGAVMGHFKTREQLVLGCIEFVLETNHKYTSDFERPEMTGYELLIGHCKQNWLWAEEFPEQVQIILLLYYYASWEKSFSELYDKILTGARARILKHLYAMKHQKLLRASNLPEISEMVHSLILGEILNAATVRKIKKNSSLSQFLERLNLVIAPLLEEKDLKSSK